MPTIKCYVSEETMEALLHAAQALGRPVYALAEAAIEAESLEYRKKNMPPCTGGSKKLFG